jgi:hypothetical protein
MKSLHDLSNEVASQRSLSTKPDYGVYYEDWERLYQQGWSSPQIAKAYGTVHGTVLRYLKSKGLTRTVAQARDLQSKTADIAAEVEQLYATGLTIDEVADQLGCQRSAIYTRIVKQGVNRNKRESRFIKTTPSRRNFDFFDSIDSQAKAYWLGFICADGWVQLGNRSSRLGIELSNMDEHHLANFAEIFDAPLVKRARTQRSGKASVMVGCRIACTYLCESLVAKGVVPKKSLSEELVQVFRYIPDNLIQGGSNSPQLAAKLCIKRTIPRSLLRVCFITSLCPRVF